MKLSLVQSYLSIDLGLNAAQTPCVCVATERVKGSHIVVEELTTGRRFHLTRDIPILYVVDGKLKIDGNYCPSKYDVIIVVPESHEGTTTLYWGCLGDVMSLSELPLPVLAARPLEDALKDFVPVSVATLSEKPVKKVRVTPSATRATKKKAKPEGKKKADTEVEKTEAVA